jgi:hypothetical protein
MKPIIQVDFKGAVQFLNRFAPYAKEAFAVALNRTAELGTRAGRDHARRVFQVRSEQALRFALPVTLPGRLRASPSRLTAIIEPERIGQIYNPFEAGGMHTRDTLGRPVAVPTSFLRKTEMTVIPRAWYPTNLGLQPVRDPKGASYYKLGRDSVKKRRTPVRRTIGGVRVLGKRGAFALDPDHGVRVDAKHAGVYIRTGPGKHDIQRLWIYREAVRRPPILQLLATIDRVTAQVWPQEAVAAFDHYKGIALRRAADSSG